MPTPQHADRFASFPFPTPAFVYQADRLLESLRRLEPLRANPKCRVLYSIKSCSLPRVLDFLSTRVDGFAASSLFEARLSREILNRAGVDGRSVHLTCPAFPEREAAEVAAYVDHINFNSLDQWLRHRARTSARPIRCGLRVNPKLSFVKDERYNPCRKYSKLGVPIEQLVDAIEARPEALEGLSGIHVHTNCESRTAAPVLATTLLLVDELAALLPRLEWINLGGGYQYDEIEDLSPLLEATNLLTQERGLDVFLEPGEAIVGNAGVLVASVLDIVENDGQKIAIIDSTVNHLPQVFEYQYQPVIAASEPDAEHSYWIAGRSCLAGDLFGEYAFRAPLEIGSRITFTGVGAYALAKSHMFNGINLPDLYIMEASAELHRIREFTFNDFWNLAGGRHASDRT